MTQDRVNQIMKDAGFANVRIVDAAYLVSATTKDGDQVMVILNPPSMQAATASSGSSAPSTTGATGSSNSTGASGSSGSTATGSSTTAPKQ